MTTMSPGFSTGSRICSTQARQALAVDRAVKDAWCCEAVAAQGPEEGQRAPVAVRGEAAQAFALCAPAAQWRHVGLDPGLVDEHQALRIETTLPGAPTPTTASDIVTRLFEREQRFF